MGMLGMDNYKRNRMKTYYFENKIWWMICRPKLDINTGKWRKNFRIELIEKTEMAPIKYYIRGQKI